MPGHVVIHSTKSKRAFGGDVQVSGSIGRTDFPVGASRGNASHYVDRRARPGFTKLKPREKPRTQGSVTFKLMPLVTYLRHADFPR